MPVFALSNSDHLKFLRNPLVAPLLRYHNRVVSTFAALPPKGKAKEIAKRIAILVVAPFAYLALGTLALIGLTLGTPKVRSFNSSVLKAVSSLRKKEMPTAAEPKVPMEVVGRFAIHLPVKEVAKLMQVSRDSSALQYYWDNMTPELAAKNEGIDLEKVNFEPYEPSDLIKALKAAIKYGKCNPFQGLKRVEAAFYAARLLNQSNIADEKYLFWHWKIHGNAVEVFRQTVCALYSFAEFGVNSHVIHNNIVKSSKETFKSCESSRQGIISCLENQRTSEHLVLKNIWESVDKFIPKLLVESKSFQQEQNEELKKWNYQFKKNAKGGDLEKVKTQLKTHRKSLYKKTKLACERGFYLNNRLVHLDTDVTKKMIKNAKLLGSKPLKPLNHVPYKTKFEIINEDTIHLAKRYKDEDLNPVVLNPANAAAQKDGLFLRSNYHKALYPHATNTDDPFYPIPEAKVVYTPDVQIFRKSEQSGFAFHDPYTLSFIAATQFEISKTSQKDIEDIADLDFFELNPTPGNRKVLEAACDKIIKKQLGANESYEKRCKEKMRIFLRVAASKGHDAVALGALGCDSFPNPRRLNAAYWEDVLAEDEFKGRFKKAGFGTQG